MDKEERKIDKKKRGGGWRKMKQHNDRELERE